MKTEKDYLSSISEAIKKAKRIHIAGHRSPDFDSAGSCFALALALGKRGKKVSVSVGELSAKMKNAFEMAGAYQKDSFLKSDLVILLDYGATRMLNQKVFERTKNSRSKVISIDHHAVEDQFGDIVWVDQGKTSAAEMVFDLLNFMKTAFNERIGFCLLLGMLSDTGVFVFQHNSDRLIPKIAKLNVRGRNFSLAFKLVRSWDSFGDFLRFSKFGSRVKFDEKLGLAYSVFTKSHSISGLRSFLANQLLLVEGLKYILILQKDGSGKGYRGSLRASAFNSKVDVGKIAGYFVGGGHNNSAAFNSKLPSAKIIEKVKELIKNQTSNFKDQNEKSKFKK